MLVNEFTLKYLNKVIQLQMLGNDINWAAFNIIEVMSSTKFTYKVRNNPNSPS